MNQDAAQDPRLLEDAVPHEPFALFADWYQEATTTSLEHPDAMTLATADAQGIPSARIVLLKAFDTQGFVFFTNYQSRKAQEIQDNAHVALVFHWDPLRRQVRIEGQIQPTSPQTSAAYFASRPRGSQLSAWASPQSQIVSDQDELVARWKEAEARFGNDEVPLPPFWGGYRVLPQRIEFWQGRANRYHDRIVYLRQPNASWEILRLAP